MEWTPSLSLTTAHERLHRLSDPRFKMEFGGKINEGMTELYACRIFKGAGRNREMVVGSGAHDPAKRFVAVE